MAFNVTPTEQYTLVPAGQYQVVCCELLDLGFNDRTFKNPDTGQNETRKNHEVQYVFQTNKINAETGKRFEIRSQPFNLILSEKASLRKFLLQWRGHDLTEAEKKPPGVDIELTGRNAIIQVVHNPQGEKTYANISSIMPLMEGMPEIQPLDYQPKQSAVNQANAQAAAQQPVNQQAPNLGAGQFSGQQPPQPVAPADIPF